MLESISIQRNIGADSERSFDALREEGIRLAQELSGRIWTDYNLHDPGVTILEQLCYALTDLIYRTGFEAKDYLTGESGEIDWRRQALYRPEAIFPSSPITIRDYRKLIFDGVPEIDNVWINTVTNGPGEGLYRIYAQLTEEAEGQEGESVRERVVNEIKSIYAANRNLCEDLEAVRIVERHHYSIHGTITVDRQSNPVEILAEFYFRGSQFLGSSIPSRSYAQILSQGKSLEEIFTGPLTEHVHIADEDLERQRESVTVSDMIEIISAIPGVRYVERLWFQDDRGIVTDSIAYDPSLDYVPRLLIPTNADQVGITVRRDERLYPVPFREFDWAFSRRDNEYRAQRQTRQDFTDLFASPQGEYRETGFYHSIQHHFPNTYGINDFGLPQSASPRRKAQAANLKAYLLFFEQIMANFLENLQQISRLFSLDEDMDRSYFHQELTEENVPNVKGLYRHEKLDPRHGVAAILARYDNFEDRRNRVLDYLLALYGETFNEEVLTHFNYYAEEPVGRAMTRHKINLLKSVGQQV